MGAQKWFYMVFMLFLSLEQSLANRLTPVHPDLPSDDHVNKAGKAWRWLFGAAPIGETYASGNGEYGGVPGGGGYGGGYSSGGSHPGYGDTPGGGSRGGRGEGGGEGSGDVGGVNLPFVPNMVPGMPKYGLGPIIGYSRRLAVFYFAPQSCYSTNPDDCFPRGFEVNSNVPVFDRTTSHGSIETEDKPTAGGSNAHEAEIDAEDTITDHATMEAMASESGLGGNF